LPYEIFDNIALMREAAEDADWEAFCDEMMKTAPGSEQS
jgi:hypothetical protein